MKKSLNDNYQGKHRLTHDFLDVFLMSNCECGNAKGFPYFPNYDNYDN